MTANIKRIGGVSGGIDSQAVALWMRQRFPPEEILLLNSTAGGNEHPITTQFLLDYSRDVFPVVMIDALFRDLGDVGTRDGETGRRRWSFDQNAKMTFADLAYIKQLFPSRRAQFCTEYLKLAPQLRWIKENVIDIDPTVTIERYVGVRRDESQKRKDTPDEQHDTYFDCQIFYPVAGWTKQQCFDYVLAAGEKINPLYMMGFGRVGCAPCVNAGKDDIREWASRFPEMIDKVRDWEKQVGRTFFAPMVPGREINFIDDVVQWSKTARGGRQPLLAFVEAEKDSCVSKYGLCE